MHPFKMKCETLHTVRTRGPEGEEIKLFAIFSARHASCVSNEQVESVMGKLVGLAAVDWSYRCKYVAVLDGSGRRRLADWEVELKKWNPDDEGTTPSGYALAALRDKIRELN